MVRSLERLQKDVVPELRRLLLEGGVQAALGHAQGMTTHRFIGIYRFDDTMLRTKFFSDRENPTAGPPGDIPVMSSYCVFVRDSGQPFAVTDAAADPRVADHPKRQQLLSYCGVPLLDEDGVMYGTACLYDVEPRAIEPFDVALLEALGPLLRAHTAT